MNRFFYPAVFQGIGELELNFQELECLEIAIYFLYQKISQPNFDFIELRDFHLRNIQYWVLNPRRRHFLRLNKKKRLKWIVMSSEDLHWLILGLEKGLSRETISLVAIDEANFRCDMEKLEVNSKEERYLASSHFVRHYETIYSNYEAVLLCRDTLLSKLKAI